MDRALKEIQPASIDQPEAVIAPKKRGRKPKATQQNEAAESNQNQENEVETVVESHETASNVPLSLVDDQDPPVALRRTTRQSKRVQNFSEPSQNADECENNESMEKIVTKKPAKKSKQVEKKAKTTTQTNVLPEESETEELADLASGEATATPPIDDYELIRPAPVEYGQAKSGKGSLLKLNKTGAKKPRKKSTKKDEENDASGDETTLASQETTTAAVSKNPAKRPKTKAGQVAFALTQLKSLSKLFTNAHTSQTVPGIKEILHSLHADNNKIAMFLANKS
jgi:hypothetical protein